MNLFSSCRNIFLALFTVSLGLSPSAETGTSVRIGADNYLEVNGESMFVIGAYALPKEMTVKQAKDMGFNLVGARGEDDYWNEAQEAGVYVWRSFGGAFDLDSGDEEKKKDRIRDTVAKYKNHPALLFWESMDEPAWTDKKPSRARATPEGLANGYRFLQTLDSSHPVYLNHAPRNTVDTLRKYNSGADIICVDIYPIVPEGLDTMYAITPDGRHGDLPNQTLSCVGEYVDKMKEVARADQAVFVVLQGFAWEGLRPEDERDASLVQYPTYEESRFMAYHAIIHGVNGIHYWGLHYTPINNPFINDLAKVLNEIRDLSHVILSPTLYPEPVLRYHERGSTIANGIELLCKKASDGIYIIAANTGIDPAAADFEALPRELDSVESLSVVGENRSVKIEDGAFFDEFEGLDVHIYTTSENY